MRERNKCDSNIIDILIRISQKSKNKQGYIAPKFKAIVWLKEYFEMFLQLCDRKREIRHQDTDE